MSTDATHLPAHTSPASRPAPARDTVRTQLTGVYEAARQLLRGTPIAAPMISRAGLRAEAHRARLILRATMNDQQRGGR